MATVALPASHRPPRTARANETRRHVFIYLGLTPFLVLAVFPIFWMLITALKQEPDLYRMDAVPFWFHLPPTLKNFDFLFHRTSYGDWIVNTMSVSLWVSAITLAVAVPAGYALARLRLPFAENLGIGIFMTYLVPGIILFIPLARVVATLDLQDSWWSLVAVYPTFTVPFCTWLLMGFFKTVPFEIEEAAMVDGCSQLGALVRIVLPVSWPGIITAMIFSFTLSMQDFLYSLAFISVSDQKPVPLGVATELIRGDVYFWGSLMAGALLVGVPVAIVYNLFLDKFITGITGAAIK
jgi:multiple sugar transport system permease protein